MCAFGSDFDLLRDWIYGNSQLEIWYTLWKYLWINITYS